MDVPVIVWVCPEPGCGNYYASKNAADMEQIVGKKGINFEPTPEAAHPRSRCPECFERGKEVLRVPVRMNASVPEPA